MPLPGIFNIICATFAIFFAGDAYAAQATLKPLPVPTTSVAQIGFDSLEPQIVRRDPPEDSFAVISGRARLTEGTLLFRNQPLMKEVSEAGLPFRLEIPLGGVVTRFELNAVNNKGKVVVHAAEVRVDEWPIPPPRRYALSGALSYSHFAYSETFAPPLDEHALTGKVMGAYRLGETGLSLGGSAYLTLVPLSSNIPNTAARFLGINLRAGYDLPWIRPPWKASLLAGVYYTTSFVTRNAFGFKGLLFPQIYPQLQRKFGPYYSASIYLKFAPLSDGFSLSVAEREWAGGISVEKTLASDHGMGATLDYSNLSFKPKATVTIELNSWNFGVFYRY